MMTYQSTSVSDEDIPLLNQSLKISDGVTHIVCNYSVELYPSSKFFFTHHFRRL
jgi:hypothetical protein